MLSLVLVERRLLHAAPMSVAELMSLFNVAKAASLKGRRTSCGGRKRDEGRR